jgi:hypothetical protein
MSNYERGTRNNPLDLMIHRGLLKIAEGNNTNDSLKDTFPITSEAGEMSAYLSRRRFLTHGVPDQLYKFFSQAQLPDSTTSDDLFRIAEVVTGLGAMYGLSLTAAYAYDMVAATVELTWPSSVKKEPFDTAFTVYPEKQINNVHAIALGDSLAIGFQEKNQDKPYSAAQCLAERMSHRNWQYLPFAFGGATTQDTKNQIKDIKNRKSKKSQDFWNLQGFPHKMFVTSAGSDNIMKYISEQAERIAHIIEQPGLYLHMMFLAYDIRKELRTTQGGVKDLLIDLTDVRDSAPEEMYMDQVVYEGPTDIHEGNLENMDLVWITDEKERRKYKKILAENKTAQKDASRMITPITNSIILGITDYEQEMKLTRRNPLSINFVDLTRIPPQYIGIMHLDEEGQRLVAEHIGNERTFVQYDNYQIPLLKAA